MEADALVLVSDIDGLYTGNPRENPDARLIPRVEEITDSLMEIAGGSGSNRGNRSNRPSGSSRSNWGNRSNRPSGSYGRNWSYGSNRSNRSGWHSRSV